MNVSIRQVLRHSMVFALGAALLLGSGWAGAAQALVTSEHTLLMDSHCEEGDVGCSNLSGVLVDRRDGERHVLSGTTHMVMCADGITPCHIGFYDLYADTLSVRAYPNGTLEITRAGHIENERGQWQRGG